MSEVGYTKLEMTFEPDPQSGYRLLMGYRAAGGDTDQRLPPTKILLDPKKLKELSSDIIEYSLALTSQVFSDQDCRMMFVEASATSKALRTPLRIQIVISPDAGVLHEIIWEALRDPKTAAALEALRDPQTGFLPDVLPEPPKWTMLASMENIWLSRYLLSQDASVVSLRPRAELKVLALAANPEDLPNYKLAPLDADGEIKRAREALAGFPVVSLGNAGAPSASFRNLMEGISSGVDILYIACHGVMTDNGPILFLANEDGKKTVRVPAGDLLQGLVGIEKKPRLVVLASCESAGKEDPSALQRIDNTFASLGPRLSALGVPAVLAMHGKISVATVEMFMPTFFKDLVEEGQVDHALSVARSLARREKRPDTWMPVLFTRSISGRLWPDTSQSSPTAAQMDTLINEVQALKDKPGGGVNIEGDHINIQGGVTVGSVVNQPAAPVTERPEAKIKIKEGPVFLPEKLSLLGTTPRLAPTDLNGMPRKFIHLTDFIFRIEEYRRFTKQLANKVDQRQKRIVAFYGTEGMGKTWLLDRIEFECVKYGIPCARVNFEKGSNNDVIEILRELAGELGEKEFDEWFELDKKWHSEAPVNLEFKTSEPPAAASANISVEHGSIEGGVVVGTQIKDNKFTITTATLEANDPKGARIALTDKFISDLEDFVTERPAVLLFEGIDHEMCYPETRAWVIDTLLNRVRELQGYGILSVVTFLKKPTLESSLERETDGLELKKLQIPQIADYFRMRGIPETFVQKEAELCFKRTGGKPASVFIQTENLIEKLKKAFPETSFEAQSGAIVQSIPQTVDKTNTFLNVETISTPTNPLPAQPSQVIEPASATAIPQADRIETKLASTIITSPDQIEAAADNQAVRAIPEVAASQVSIAGVVETAQPETTQEAESARIEAVAETLAEGSETFIPETPHENVPVRSEVATDAAAEAEVTPMAQTLVVETPASFETSSQASAEDINDQPQATSPAEPRAEEQEPVAEAATVELTEPETVEEESEPESSSDETESEEDLRRYEEEEQRSLESMLDRLLADQSPLVALTIKQTAVLRWFSLEDITNITGDEVTLQTAEGILARIQEWRFVQELSQQRYSYRPEVRKYLSNLYRVENPAQFRVILHRAHDSYDRELAGINLFDETVWTSLNPSQKNALREKLYYLLQLDVKKGFDLLNALFKSAKRLLLLGEASTLLRFAQELDQAGLPDLYRNRLIYYESLLDYSSGDVEAALEKINQLLDSLNGAALDGELKAQILSHLGVILNYNKNHAEAISAFEQSQKIWREIKQDREVAKLSNDLGNVYNSQREYDLAEKAFNQALTGLRKWGTPAEEAQTLNNLGNVHRNRKEWDKAVDFYQKSLAIKRQSGDLFGAARTQINLGSAYTSMAADPSGTRQAELRQNALEAFQAALKTFSESGARSMQADVLRRLALLYFQDQQIELAREKFNEAIGHYTALKMWTEIDNPDTRNLAGKLGIQVESGARVSSGEAGKPPVQPGPSGAQLMQRVSSAGVATTKEAPKTIKTDLLQSTLQQLDANTKAGMAMVAGVTEGIAGFIPTFPKKDSVQAALQQLDAKTKPAVVTSVKSGLAGFDPAAADLAKRAAMLRSFDTELLAAISTVPYDPSSDVDIPAQITKLAFVQADPRERYIYKSAEQAYLRESLQIEHPELISELNQRAYQFFNTKILGIEALRSAWDLLPHTYFFDLQDKLYYLLKLDLTKGIGLLNDLILLCVEKANQFKAVGESAQSSNVKEVVGEASALLAVAREIDKPPAAAQDQLIYFELLLDNAAGNPGGAETKLRTLNGRQLENELKAQVMGQLGVVETNKGNYDAAVKFFEQAQAIWTKLKRDLENAKVSNNLGNVYLRKKDFGRAEKSFRDALSGLTRVGKPADQAQSLNNLGNLYMQQENWVKAVESYEKSLVIKKTLDDRFGIATTQTNLGMVYQRQGQGANSDLQAELREKAVNCYLDAVNIFRKVNARAHLGRALFALSYLYAQAGEAEEAREYLPEAMQIFKELGMPELANASKLAEKLGA
ncbi:MAG TPA: tetratricopeptide repeat protein [Anaerolineales bacterium]|jgi:tetratricopeptide (TPR) repeat protein